MGQRQHAFIRLGCRRCARRILEEERHRDLQDLRDLLQPASADAVRTLLVFLHLLEGQAERFAQFLLAHCKHFPAHAHSAADMSVNGIWSLLGDGVLVGWRLRSARTLRSDHGNQSAERNRVVFATTLRKLKSYLRDY